MGLFARSAVIGLDSTGNNNRLAFELFEKCETPRTAPHYSAHRIALMMACPQLTAHGYVQTLMKWSGDAAEINCLTSQHIRHPY